MNQASTLSTLIKRFENKTRQMLEQSIALALKLQHTEVQFEHVLYCALNQNENELLQLCQQLSIKRELLTTLLMQTLESFPKSLKNETPHLAHTLVDMIQSAWQISSIERQQTHIHINDIFIASLRLQEELRYSHTIDCLKSLSSETCLNILLKIASQNKLTTQNQSDILSQYTENLSEKAASGKLDPVIGREAETHQLINILCRRRQNNPILVGEAGVGKTAIVEGLALNIHQGNVPEKFKNTQLLALDITALQAGAAMKGEFEQRLKDIMQAIQQSPQPIILFIDEVHNLMGAGSKSETGDAANLLKPALARGELRTIAATTYAEYKKHIEHDAALTRRFETINVNEPTQEQAVTILRGIKDKLEKHHTANIDDAALAAAVKLSVRYIPARQLPDKAVSLLDTACARAHLSQTTNPIQLTAQEAELAQTQLYQKQLQQAQLFSDEHNDILLELGNSIKTQQKKTEQLTQKVEKEKKLFEDIQAERQAILNTNIKSKKLLRQKIKKLKKFQKEMPLVYPTVNSELIANVVSDWTGIPLSRMLKDDVNATLSLGESLQKRIIGQENAIKTISEHLQITGANLHDPNKPRGIFLLAGTSGVGKTETALALAELLYGGEQNLTVINMSEFKEPHKVSMLTGAPAGYVGYGEGGILTEAVKRKPYSVILLDEMEKAHPNIQEVFYQVFDKGVIMDGEGCQVDFKNTLILMASNAGTEVMMQLAQQNLENPQKQLILKQLDAELKKIFKPAFLGRVTVVPYQPLPQPTLSKIVNMKLQKIAERITQHYHCTVSFKSSLINYITERCTDISTGARNIDLVINKEILPELSQFFLQQLLEGVQVDGVNISMSKGKLKVSFLN